MLSLSRDRRLNQSRVRGKQKGRSHSEEARGGVKEGRTVVRGLTDVITPRNSDSLGLKLPYNSTL